MRDTLDVIEHNPRFLQIFSKLHSFDQMYPGSRPHLKHLENKHLVQVQAQGAKPCPENLFPYT